MSLKRDLLTSFGLQGAGAAAVLLATLLLGARLGPEVQGGFSHIKAQIEFVAALSMFGLPQALFFHVKSGRLSGREALRWTACCALLALPLAALYAVWQALPLPAIAALAAAVGALVAHGILRALLLVRERTVWFNMLTAFPQLLVLVGVGLVLQGIVRADVAQWLALFALAYGTAGAIAWRRLVRAPREGEGVGVGWQALVRYGLATWLAAALLTAATLLVQRWVDVRQGHATLGQFSMAMTLVQVPLTPISYAAPLLFRRWMERPGTAVSRRIAATVSLVLLSCAGLVWCVAWVRPDLGLGSLYAGVTRSVAVLLVGGAAEAAIRVLAVQASANGTPSIAVWSEVARSSVLALAWWTAPAPSLLQICAAWALGAWAAAGIFVWFAHVDAQRAVA